MSKRHCPEVHEPSPGKRPRQIGSPGDYPPISEKHEKPQERSYSPPRQCQTECSAECCTKEWRKPLVIPEVAARLGVHKRPYSPPLSKSDSYHHHQHHPSDEELAERAKQHYYHHQQRSVSSTETPLSVPVPRPPSQPTMEPPKKGHTLVHMDSRIESSKMPTSRCSQQEPESDSTRYHRHHTPSNDHVSSSPERDWVQRWPKSAKWLELSKYLDNFVLFLSSTMIGAWTKAVSMGCSQQAREMGRAVEENNCDTAHHKGNIGGKDNIEFCI